MEFKDLQNHFSKPGRVVLIQIRRKRLEPVDRLAEVTAVAGVGLEGDRYSSKDGDRQVTLIQKEHLENASSFLGRPVAADLVRRNIVVEGLNLLALKGKKFQVGETILEYTGECHPCSRMETNLGRGGYNAMRGHGGITARILQGGVIREGDPVVAVPGSDTVN